MKEWIEINVPWNTIIPPVEHLLPYPDLDEEVRAKFGYTSEELREQLFENDTEELREQLFENDTDNRLFWQHPDWVEFDAKYDAILDDIYYTDHYSSEEKTEKLADLMEEEGAKNPAFARVWNYKKIHKEISAFVENHPDFIAACDANEELRKKHNEAYKGTSFRNLAKPGTVIEVKTAEGKIHQMMIGNINTNGGVCDDCRGISDNDIVLRYMVVWSKDDNH